VILHLIGSITINLFSMQSASLCAHNNAFSAVQIERTQRSDAFIRTRVGLQISAPSRRPFNFLFLFNSTPIYNNYSQLLHCVKIKNIYYNKKLQSKALP
jgi:hypothetical protein